MRSLRKEGRSFDLIVLVGLFGWFAHPLLADPLAVEAKRQGANHIARGQEVVGVLPVGNTNDLIKAVFQQTPRYETPLAVSVIVLLAVVSLSISVLERQVRGVEVVS